MARKDNPQQPRKRGTHRPNQAGSTKTGRMMLIILLGLALCIAAFMAAIYPVVMRYTDRDAEIMVPANATPQSVRDTLDKHLGKEFASNVLRLAKIRGVDISTRHGYYAVPKGSNAFAVMRKLTSGAQTPVQVTINGFRDMDKMAELISRKMEFPKDSLLEAMNDPAFLAEYGLTPENSMALFLDDTYEVYWTTSARDLMRKIGENYKYFWNEENTAKAAAFGLTPAQMTTLASIVDEETNHLAEKGTIGRLYINRLKNDMRLQADPTVRFALGNFMIQRVTGKDLQVESPYNTYKVKGLPPGPIRTTSARTIRKIFDEPANNYLYMCAREDFSGVHNFAVSYEEHKQNAARYQQALDERGITR